MSKNGNPVDPKPPGVTVLIRPVQPSDPRMDGTSPGYFGMALLDGVKRAKFQVLAGKGPTPEAAEADCQEKLGELVARLTNNLPRKVLVAFVRE